MKILVIGARGFIGSHCVKYFSNQGHEVFEADIAADSSKSYCQLSPANTDYSVIFIDNQFDVCINASGSANVGFSFDHPNIDFELNVLNVQKLMVCIRNYNPKCKFINFSSAAVYGNPNHLPIKEEAVGKPLSPYGFHKLQSELLLAEYHHFFGLKTCSLRVFSAYGPGLKKQLFWDLYQKCLATEHIQLYGTGNESRDFIYIDDLLQIIDLIIKESSFEGDVYNVGNGSEITIKKAVELFIKYFAPQKQHGFSGQVKMGDPNNWAADISKLKTIGYGQKVDFEEGIKKLAAWLRELR